MNIPLRDSIRFRLLALASVLLGAALVAGYLFIAAILEDFITRRFDAETRTIAEAVIAGASISGSGRVTVAQPPGDPRFSMPLSGWYWQLSQDGQVVAKSPSLFDGTLPAPAGEWQAIALPGPDGAPLRVMQTDFTLPDSDQPLSVAVSAPATQIAQELAHVRRPLAVSLAVLGLALAAAMVLQVTAGLRSLDVLGRDIRRIRAGRAESLPLPAVAELRPVAAEINGLLDQNRKVLARSREHVGNLAHSLKTPLSALANSLPPDHEGQPLLERMDRQIGWHLRRARSAATPHVLGQRTPIAPVIEDILLVLRRPVEDAGLAVERLCDPGLVFPGDRQDLEEMIGNLTENAVKWARRRIRIAAALSEGTIRIAIEDDGPGMPGSDHDMALRRGRRLDETGPPGAGLGLAIVTDLVALHGGRLTLSRSDLGGLHAELTLPA